MAYWTICSAYKLHARRDSCITRPYYFVDLELSDFGVRLIVGNSGSSPAHDISFKVTDSIPWRENQFLSGFNSLRIIKNGISYLAPNRILKYEVGYFDWDNLKKDDIKAEFSIIYEDHLRKKHQIEFYIDMGQYDMVLLESFKRPESEIARAIEKNRKK